MVFILRPETVPNIPVTLRADNKHLSIPSETVVVLSATCVNLNVKDITKNITRSKKYGGFSNCCDNYLPLYYKHSKM